jgi:hypothetical protein
VSPDENLSERCPAEASGTGIKLDATPAPNADAAVSIKNSLRDFGLELMAVSLQLNLPIHHQTDKYDQNKEDDFKFSQFIFQTG